MISKFSKDIPNSDPQRLQRHLPIKIPKVGTTNTIKVIATGNAIDIMEITEKQVIKPKINLTIDTSIRPSIYLFP